MTANELSKKFLLWFQQEFPEARIYRNNAGCFKTLAGAWIRYGIPNKGGSDHIAFVPEKVLYYENNNQWKNQKNILTVKFYETKTAKDKMSKDQIKFADLVTSMGGEYYIVHEYTEKDWYNHKNHTEYLLVGDFFIEKWSVK